MLTAMFRWLDALFVDGLRWLARFAFGTFETEEFRKFLRMGVIFGFIIGCYWTLRVLKDSVFANLVGAEWQPYAKTVSLVALFPLVILYTKLIEKHSREEVFYTLAYIYSIATFLFASALMLGIQAPADVIAARTGFYLYGTKIFGYLWYVFVESYGSLVVALFWAIAADITSPDSAKRGFPLVVAIGQLGGIFGPRFVSQLPKRFDLSTSAVSVYVCAIATALLIFLMRRFLRVTPKSLLMSFHGKNEATVEKEQEPGFFEGLKLLLQHKYLFGIFGILFIYELITTIFDFNFKLLAATQYKGVELDAYLGQYGSAVNLVALLCLLFGVSNITRFLGVGVALALMPIIFGGAIYGFLSFNEHLAYLFWLMVGAKAINYALNGPAIKQLYIPTTHDVKFKSQAWIETFGSRGSKEAGSLLNMSLKPIQRTFGNVAGRMYYIQFAGFLSFALIALWFVTSLFLGRTYKKAIDSKSVVC